MRSAAPPVRYTSQTGDAAWRCLQRTLGTLAGGSAAAWAAAWFGADALATAAVAGCGAVAGSLAMGLALGPAGFDLSWDGASWSCDGVAGVVSLRMDLGSHALLRFEPSEADRRVRWLAVSRGGAPHAWHALRVALVATPNPRAASAAAAT